MESFDDLIKFARHANKELLIFRNCGNWFPDGERVPIVVRSFFFFLFFFSNGETQRAIKEGRVCPGVVWYLGSCCISEGIVPGPEKVGRVVRGRWCSDVRPCA